MNLKTFWGISQYICVALVETLRTQIALPLEWDSLLDLSDFSYMTWPIFKEAESSGRDTPSVSG